MPDKTGETPAPPAEDASQTADDTKLPDGEVPLTALLPAEVKLPGLPPGLPAVTGLQAAPDGTEAQAASGLASAPPPGGAAPGLSPATASVPADPAEPSPVPPQTMAILAGKAAEEKAASATASAAAPADPRHAASRQGQAVLLTAGETRATGQMLSDRLQQAQADTLAPPAAADTPLSGSFADEAALTQQPAETRRLGAEAAGHVPRAAQDGPPPAERQIVTAILSSGTGRTDILLDPQDLGRVRLTLEGNEAGIVVTIQAERSETADLLRRNADLLAEEFREAGYTDLTFSFADRGETASPPDRHTDSPQGTEPEFVATPPPLPPTPGPRGSALLDLRL
jgi:flagellar hook-length control protein FliK